LSGARRKIKWREGRTGQERERWGGHFAKKPIKKQPKDGSSLEMTAGKACPGAERQNRIHSHLVPSFKRKCRKGGLGEKDWRHRRTGKGLVRKLEKIG